MAGYVIHLIIADEYLRKTEEVIKDKEEFIKGVIYPDSVKIKGETHYSPYYSSDVNLYEFVKANIDKLDEDFYKGYFLHLLTDFLFYKKHFVLPKAGIATEIIHNDYDILNNELLEKYKTNIPEDLKKFCNRKEGNPVYVKREHIYECIDDCSSYNLVNLAKKIYDEKDFYKVLNVERRD